MSYFILLPVSEIVAGKGDAVLKCVNLIKICFLLAKIKLCRLLCSELQSIVLFAHSLCIVCCMHHFPYPNLYCIQRM